VSGHSAHQAVGYKRQQFVVYLTCQPWTVTEKEIVTSQSFPYNYDVIIRGSRQNKYEVSMYQPDMIKNTDR